MTTLILNLLGNQIGTFTSLLTASEGIGNAVLQGAQALGNESQCYKVTVDCGSSGEDDHVSVTDPSGNVLADNCAVSPGLGIGLQPQGCQLVLPDNNLFIDLDGCPSEPSWHACGHVDPQQDCTGFDWGQLPQAPEQVDTHEPAPEYPDLPPHEAPHAEEPHDPHHPPLPLGDDPDPHHPPRPPWRFPCLGWGTLVGTAQGPVPAQDLAPGDRVMTASGALRNVLWVGCARLKFDEENASQRPVLIKAGRLGHGLPLRDLQLSPQHRVLLEGTVVAAHNGGLARALAPARSLTELPGVRVMEGRKQVRYVTILLDSHDIMLAEGTPVESFYPGPEGMKTLSPEFQAQVANLIPGFAEKGAAAYGAPAAPFLRMRQARDLVRELGATGVAVTAAEQAETVHN